MHRCRWKHHLYHLTHNTGKSCASTRILTWVGHWTVLPLDYKSIHAYVSCKGGRSVYATRSRTRSSEARKREGHVLAGAHNVPRCPRTTTHACSIFLFLIPLVLTPHILLLPQFPRPLAATCQFSGRSYHHIRSNRLLPL
jgi:hypothetical protein